MLLFVFTIKTSLICQFRKPVDKVAGHTILCYQSGNNLPGSLSTESSQILFFSSSLSVGLKNEFSKVLKNKSANISTKGIMVI